MAITQNYKLNLIQWYPGHIAKAEKNLKEQLKRVDVVLEVRDARIPLATHHPQISEWVGSKARVLVINRVDMITPQVRSLWIDWFKRQGEVPYFTNAQHGKGIAEIMQAAQAAGVALNQRRRDRGMLPRPVRAVVIGFPNVGKSALINRLLGKRVVESAARPGVTRQLRWVRISEHLELLDAPGVIPARMEDQEAALKLAICDDIGEASYDNQLVAAALVDLLNYLEAVAPDLLPKKPLQSRYELDSISDTGDVYLHALAEHRYKGDVERAARQLLTDFRKGLLGTLPLELPPN
ncbi:ribosome biogenesis GTPase YlqF [Komarekiella sp. 'clone 1']|uniref:Ribosome biogenesis GTPase A n=1 Tax=Komarekiella delphini-convector SJRDD-AB1 TaxID=2593771 RepID=A0AA40VT71_9NOST|nr:ribosome biogenesis GTPase YlqF [Komarekiella delphini-convector]MBD6618914.1 ribosome biogenesis GTPase YlqF [Komarekiella delphini-convector SJRDD-AB1]